MVLDPFWGAALGDRRRTRRLVSVAQRLAGRPGGTMTSVFDSPKSIKAAYRLWDCPAVTHDSVIAAHVAQVRQRCREPGQVLLIEDTSALEYHSRDACTGLGPIGEDFTQGFWLHTTLAVRCDDEASRGGSRCHDLSKLRVIGLFDQQAWARPQGVRKTPKRKCETLRRDRESQRWARSLQQVKAPADDNTCWIYVADRESDIYEVFDRCAQSNTRFVIRANQDRALHEEDRHIFEAVAASPCLGQRTIELRRPGLKTRQATLEARAITVTLRAPWRPDSTLVPRQVNIIEVREVNPPAGEEPLCWRLLTDLPIDTIEQMWRVVDIYRGRWLIEEFHKALKTGLGVEQSQLSTADKLMALTGVLSVVATMLIDLKLQARADPDRPLEPGQVDDDVLAVLEHKQGRPPDGWTAAAILIAIAKLGGYMARKRDGPPGWLTIWRGWQIILLLVEGYRLARDPPRCG
ncbi:MAG: IS4 family transposase [Phycisphaeraceae bacterium]